MHGAPLRAEPCTRTELARAEDVPACRFHRKLHTWFVRLQRPVQITQQFERGQVAFFNACRPGWLHPLVKRKMAEVWPGGGGDGTPAGRPVGRAARAQAAEAAAKSNGWEIMQARDFSFEYEHMCKPRLEGKEHVT